MSLIGGSLPQRGPINTINSDILLLIHIFLKLLIIQDYIFFIAFYKTSLNFLSILCYRKPIILLYFKVAGSVP